MTEMIHRYAALYEPNLKDAFIGVAIFVPSDGGWWQVGGNPGGHGECGHRHRTYEAAEKCGAAIERGYGRIRAQGCDFKLARPS
jgi:hypothetical protein